MATDPDLVAAMADPNFRRALMDAVRTEEQPQPSGEVDLDDLFDSRRLSPQVVKLGGHRFHVRRDMTAEETRQYLTHAAAAQGAADKSAATEASTQAFAIMLASLEEAQLWEATVTGLPRAHMNEAVAKVMAIAGMAEFTQDAAGEA